MTNGVGKELRGVKLTNSFLLYLKETGRDLTGADLTGADLTGANLRSVKLIGAKLTSALLGDTNLSGANLSRADLSDAHLAGASLDFADLTGANLTGANLTGAYLVGANLTLANLTGADLTSANLTNANLTGANLTGAYLVGAFLDFADLTGANLTGANLTGANLANADLTDVTFHKTHWTDGTIKNYERPAIARPRQTTSGGVSATYDEPSAGPPMHKPGKQSGALEEILTLAGGLIFMLLGGIVLGAFIGFPFLVLAWLLGADVLSAKAQWVVLIVGGPVWGLAVISWRFESWR